jgi:hypothetical protein
MKHWAGIHRPFLRLDTNINQKTGSYVKQWPWSTRLAKRYRSPVAQGKIRQIADWFTSIAATND